MKRIVDGKTYNTETAVLIGEFISPYISRDDFYYVDEGLYKTKKGAFFLAGYGGAATRYKKITQPGASSAGSKIIPLTKKEALVWAESHLHPEIVIQSFKVDEA